MTTSIIFDMDGVLIDSEGPKFSFLTEAFQRSGLSLDEKYRNYLQGRAVLKFLNEILTDRQTIDKIWHLFQTEYLEHIENYIQAIPLTVDFIKELDDDVKIAVASNGFSNVNRKIINYLGIADKVKVVVSREDVANLKPHPEIYLKAAELLESDPEQCIVIEDSIVGATAALNAYMKCYILLNNYNLKKDFESIKISGYIQHQHDLHELIRL